MPSTGSADTGSKSPCPSSIIAVTRCTNSGAALDTAERRSQVESALAGNGTVRCNNGQALPVRITAQGLGLTAGKWKIDNGKGRFTDVHDIREVYGNYAHASASAGLVKSAETQLLSKGNVSLALAGGGEGINLGVEVGAFHIKPAR